jgi:hypothetical protein
MAYVLVNIWNGEESGYTVACQWDHREERRDFGWSG